EDVEPALPRQRDVEEDDGEVPLGGAEERALAVGDVGRPVALDLEVQRQAGGDGLVVLDDEHVSVQVAARADTAASGPGMGRGRVTRKIEPPPGFSSSSTRPEWARTMARTMASPRPKPAARLCEAARPRANSSKMRRRSSSGTPGPLSSTSIWTWR